jgi:hypothetical protein
MLLDLPGPVASVIESSTIKPVDIGCFTLASRPWVHNIYENTEAEAWVRNGFDVNVPMLIEIPLTSTSSEWHSFWLIIWVQFVDSSDVFGKYTCPQLISRFIVLDMWHFDIVKSTIQMRQERQAQKFGRISSRCAEIGGCICLEIIGRLWRSKQDKVNVTKVGAIWMWSLRCRTWYGLWTWELSRLGFKVQNNFVNYLSRAHSQNILLKSRGLSHRLQLSRISGQAKAVVRPWLWPGLAWPNQAWLGLAHSLKPGCAHHYTWLVFDI